MEGCPVILNNLIIRTFRLKCKDERRRRNNRLGCILPLQEKHAELFKKEGGVFKKDLDVFKNPQGLFATYSASCLFVKCVRTHRATHTYA